MEHDTPETPETYVQVIDFTPAGAGRFTAFLSAHGRADLNPDACRLECLGVLEERINADESADWVMVGHLPAEGVPAVFTATDDDLILDAVVLE